MDSNRICKDACKKVYMYCRNRRKKIFCAKYKREFSKIKSERRFQIQNAATVSFTRSMSNTGEDTFDSKGDDISAKEFLENEIFFDLQ